MGLVSPYQHLVCALEHFPVANRPPFSSRDGVAAALTPDFDSPNDYCDPMG